MARRTVTITQLRYAKKHSRDDNKYMDLAALPDGGDFLSFASGVWCGLRPRDLHDPAKQRYCEPADVIRKGRSLTLTSLAGVYGDPGSVRDVSTGKERLAHEGDLTNAIPLRVALFVPVRGTSALLFIEHVAGIAFGSRFLDHLKLCWGQRYPDWTLYTSTLTRPDAWLANAQLEAVTAEVYNHHTNLEDVGVPDTVGILTTTLEPKKGARYLPRNLLERLQGSALQRAALLGMREEPDEVKVTLGDGEQRKTFVLGKDKTPAIRLLVTDYNEPALRDDRFRAWCGAEVASHFRGVGVDWQPSMLEGSWAREALEERVVFDDGR